MYCIWSVIVKGRPEPDDKGRLGPSSSGQVENVDPIVQELCESRGGRPGLSVLTSFLVSVDVKLY